MPRLEWLARDVAVPVAEEVAGVPAEPDRGDAAVARAVAVDVKVLRVAFGVDDLPRPKHVARGHSLPPVDAFAIALIKPSRSALC